MQSVASGAILLVVVAFVLYRQMRPQPVRPRRAVVLAGIIVAFSVFSLAGTNRLTAHPLAVIMAIPVLLVGFVGGLLLMRSIHFWRDRATRAIWMHGGVVYIAMWLATVLLREWAATGTKSQ